METYNILYGNNAIPTPMWVTFLKQQPRIRNMFPENYDIYIVYTDALPSTALRFHEIALLTRLYGLITWSYLTIHKESWSHSKWPLCQRIDIACYDPLRDCCSSSTNEVSTPYLNWYSLSREVWQEKWALQVSLEDFCIYQI